MSFESPLALVGLLLVPLAAAGYVLLHRRRGLVVERFTNPALYPNLVDRRPGVRLLYAGPELDPAEGAALRRALDERPWARWVGPVDHARMAALLSRADVVLNCSISEGGMANSVLEALALGRAVLASDIEGNRSLIEDGVTGCLFRDEAGFETRAAALAADPALRQRLGRAGRELVERRYPAAREIEGYLGVYRALVPVPA